MFLPAVDGLGVKKDPLGPAFSTLVGDVVSLDAATKEDGLLGAVEAELEAMFAGVVAARENCFLEHLLVGVAAEVDVLFARDAASEVDDMFVGASSKVEALFAGAGTTEIDDMFDCIYKTT